MGNDNSMSYEQLLKLNTHLISKNKRLEAKLTQRTKYVSELSHRLRTPLSAILGMSSLAKSSTDLNLIKNCLDKIDFSSHMLLNSLNEILELDAVRKGNLVIHNASFDFKLLMSSISSMCSAECGNKNIYYDVTLTGVTEESLIGDSTYLNRALMILLMRAVSVTDSGGHVKLRITQRNINKDYVQMQFCIIDTGCALSSDEMKQFTNKSDNSNIALVKHLCSLMNGLFTFESKKGIGSVFSMSIPFGINPAVEITTKDIVDSYRVLLVSHDEKTIEVVTDLLQRIGTKCVFVSDTTKATIALLEASTMNKNFNLCLIDWGDSIADGVNMTAEIRNAENDNLKIVVLSNTSSPDIESSVRTAGADTYLPKPIYASTVFNLMMELTGREYTQLVANPNDFDFTGNNVLLAEDNDLSAQITMSQLSAVGIYADRAENGRDCLDILQSARPNYYDLIILDIRMPYMDGCQTSLAIRSLNRADMNKVPIIALTADAFASDIDAAFQAKMDDYVVKPIDTFQLYTTIAKYIKKK